MRVKINKTCMLFDVLCSEGNEMPVSKRQASHPQFLELLGRGFLSFKVPTEEVTPEPAEAVEEVPVSVPEVVEPEPAAEVDEPEVVVPEPEPEPEVVVPEPEPEPEVAPDDSEAPLTEEALDNMEFAELRELAGSLGVKGRSRDDLIQGVLAVSN